MGFDGCPRIGFSRRGLREGIECAHDGRAIHGFWVPALVMYVTGVIELASAILVVVPRFAAVGAGLIVCVMIGAVVSLLSHGQAAMVGAPVVLFILAVIVGTLRGWGGVRSLRRA